MTRNITVYIPRSHWQYIPLDPELTKEEAEKMVRFGFEFNGDEVPDDIDEYIYKRTLTLTDEDIDAIKEAPIDLAELLSRRYDGRINVTGDVHNTLFGDGSDD